MIQYICIGDQRYINLVQFCQAFQNVKSDHSQGGSHMAGGAFDVEKALGGMLAGSGLPKGPEKPAEAEVKRLARKLGELGILRTDDTAALDAKFPSLAEKDVLIDSKQG